MGTVVRHCIVLVTVGAAVVLLFARPPIAQDPAYHRMADQRTLVGIPNCLDVVSNLPFAVVGLLGLAALFRRGSAGILDDPWTRWPYATLFAGATLTAFGSAYYHLAPDNARLVWDRLPMTLAFMGLLAAVIAERIGPRAGRLLFVPLLALGAGSVVYWYRSELGGAGDLRPYALVQFGSLLVIVLLLGLHPARAGGAAYLWAGLAAYAAAKGLELADRQIFAMGEIVSGHTLKHLAAAGAIGCIKAMLASRVPRSR